MKKIIYLLLIAFTILQSCTKKNDDSQNQTGLSQDIKNFVSQSIIDSLRKWGMAINEGMKPPIVNGIYNDSLNLCTFDNSGFNRAGTHFVNYHYKFYDQDNNKLTIMSKLRSSSGSATDTATGTGSFLSGSENAFTLFADVKGSLYGIDYEMISIFSGTLTESGIQNFQYCIYMKNKGDDPDNNLISIGASRIFKDEDGFAEKITNF